MNLAVLLAIGVLFVCLAIVFRRTLGTLQNPKSVMERPKLPKGLDEVVIRLDMWKSQGRITREDYERLMHLCREDVEALQKPAKN